jgi:hypothetical protein
MDNMERVTWARNFLSVTFMCVHISFLSRESYGDAWLHGLLVLPGPRRALGVGRSCLYAPRFSSKLWSKVHGQPSPTPSMGIVPVHLAYSIKGVDSSCERGEL